MRDYTKFPETRAERKERLLPFLLAGHTTCPTTDGIDLEIWEELRKVYGPIEDLRDLPF